jgi:transketolase
MGAQVDIKTEWKLGDKIATREAYGQALLELGKINSEIVVLDADLSGSTQTKLFAKEFPDRFFNMGIAENNMMGVSAGLALAGKIPFASSFAMFAAGRAWEFVRNSIAHNHANVKVCATHAGLTVGEDGASHQVIEDLALMRAIPTMVVIVPADAREAYEVIYEVAKYHGPCYVRLGRAKVPVCFGEDYKFQIGKANIIQPGTDISIVSCGMMTPRAIEAAKILEAEGIKAELINSASIKPLDAKTIVTSATKTGSVLTLEEHNIEGGLGDAVASAILEKSSSRIKFKRLGVNDIFGQSGDAYELLDHYGLSVQDIVREAKSLINK